MVLHSEQEAYRFVLIMHIRNMARNLSRLPADKWDWTFHQAAPTPRTLAQHTIQWLQCDRQHIAEPDATKHRPVPEIPLEPSEICDAMNREADEWEKMLSEMTAEDLDRPGKQFAQEGADMNTRGFVAHMVQNAIYKNGQFSTIFFALCLDGDGPYEAPFPNPIYSQILGIE